VRIPFRPDTRQAFVTCGRLVIFTMAFGLIEQLGFKVWQDRHPEWVQPSFAGAIVTGCFGLIAYGYVLQQELRRQPERWRDLGGWTPGTWPVIAAFLMLTGGTMIGGSEVGNLLSAVWPVSPLVRELFDRLMADPLAAIFLAAVVAPFTEELFFRGIILRRLLQTGSPRHAILLSAFLFAGMHANPWQFADTFVAGLVLGWVYFRTGSLALCVAGHALNNLVAVLGMHGMLPVVRGFSGPRADGIVFHPWWFDIVGAMLLVAGAIAFNRLAPRAVARRIPPVLGVELPGLPTVESR
jgi:uncharacterized protein